MPLACRGEGTAGGRSVPQSILAKEALEAAVVSSRASEGVGRTGRQKGFRAGPWTWPASCSKSLPSPRGCGRVPVGGGFAQAAEISSLALGGSRPFRPPRDFGQCFPEASASEVTSGLQSCGALGPRRVEDVTWGSAG